MPDQVVPVDAGSADPPVADVARDDVGDILVVDDDALNLLAIEAALGDLAGRVVRAQSGAEALRKLLEQDFALILLDVRMPSLNGLETAKLIRRRERSRTTPIIFVTAHERDDREVLEGYSLGAVDFLFKPLSAPVLRAKAAVFVDLQRRAKEVARQAELLRLHERREHEQKLAEERARWEREALRRQMEEERRIAQELARKADELARTIADLERAEAKLTRANRRLEEADRRKDEFLALLGHELRNPLAPLAHGLEVLRMFLDGRPDEDLEGARATRDLMERQVAHFRRLVDDLLDVSRITRGRIELRLQPLDFAEAVNLALDTTRPVLDERQQRLVLSLPDRPLPLRADPVRLTQVVANLLSNASRYSEPGSPIELEARVEGDAVVLDVRDHGRGIDPKVLPRIFELFVQERRGGEGLGLGLTLVRHFVDLHGGEVSVHSDGLGRGSRFSVRLPLDPSAADGRAPRADVKREEGGCAPLRVVVVDDHADIRESLCKLLQLWGHDVAAAADGEEGVEAILRLRPDVAFVDIAMPLVDGFAVAERVRTLAPGQATWLVAMTGYGQERDRRRALAAGFDEHLVKPADRAGLLRALERRSDRNAVA